MIPKEIRAVIDCEIPVNSSRRVKHMDCSEGKDAAMSVKHVNEGYVFNCFRCGYKGFVGNRKLPAHQIVRMVNSISTKAHMEMEHLELPADTQWMDSRVAENDIPIDAYVWLWDAGITDELMSDYSFGWSSTYQRIIVPITDEEDELVGWIGRDPWYDPAKGYGQAKYILRKQQGLQKRIYFTCQSNFGKKVVFVEDILSAIRVHKATGLETVALLNTHIGTDLLREYMAYKVVVWLDPGKLADMVETMTRCQTYGINCKFISTDKDPKAYNDISIREQFRKEDIYNG